MSYYVQQKVQLWLLRIAIASLNVLGAMLLLVMLVSGVVLIAESFDSKGTNGEVSSSVMEYRAPRSPGP